MKIPHIPQRSALSPPRSALCSYLFALCSFNELDCEDSSQDGLGAMKTLLLLRHAKSSKDIVGIRDFDRPLNERGVEDASLIGRYARKQKITADLVISSPAKRARETAELFIKSSGLKVELQFDERIYEASVYRLIEVASEIPEPNGSVILVGHNPGFEELFSALTGDEPRLPTAALACIELGIDSWDKLKGHRGDLKWVVTPKQLKRD